MIHHIKPLPTATDKTKKVIESIGPTFERDTHDGIRIMNGKQHAKFYSERIPKYVWLSLDEIEICRTAR